MSTFLAVIGVTAAFVCGLLGGGIVNLVATRLARHRPMFGSLHCTRGPHALLWWQAVPVAGYAIQRGRCKQCGRALSVTYPCVEIVAGVLLGLLALVEGWGVAFAFHAAYLLFLLLVLVVDWRHRDIYLSVIVAGSLVAIVGSLVVPGASIVSGLIAAGVGGAFFLAAYLLARLIFRGIEEPLGLGDVLLALMMGLMLGFPNIVGALLVGPLLAGAGAAVLLISRRSKMGDFMPYGVALCVATMLFIIYPGPFAEALRLPGLASAVGGLFGGR